MKKIVFLFPGQGSQAQGMGRALYETFATVRRVFAEAGTALSRDMEALCFDTPDDELAKTENAQPALFALSMAISALLKEEGLVPDAVAGFSLGEISALCAAEVFSLRDGFSIVKARSEAMRDAALRHNGAMSAVLGLTPEVLEPLCAQIPGFVMPVNYNCPGQIVVAGDYEAVALLEKAAAEAGAKRCIRLSSPGAFHTPHMASEAFAQAMASIPYKAPQILSYSNRSGKPFADLDLPHELYWQMQSPVRWQNIGEDLLARGMTDWVEVGPGKTLAGFARRLSKDIRTWNVDTPQALETAITALKA